MFTLYRTYKKDCTVGRFEYPDGIHSAVTLERPWLNNIPNRSCIPEGDYLVKRDKHGRHQWWSVQDVEGRTFIEFHEGAIVQHSLGCILLGTRFDNGTLFGSTKALMQLLEFHGDEDFILRIKEG